jgi:hypothetical protein
MLKRFDLNLLQLLNNTDPYQSYQQEFVTVYEIALLLG